MYFLWRWWRTWLTVCCFGYWVVECVKLSFKERNSADWNLKPTILRYSLESRQRIKTALMLELHKCVKVLHCAELSGLVSELRSSWAGLSWWWCTEVVVMVKTCFVVDLPCVERCQFIHLLVLLSGCQPPPPLYDSLLYSQMPHTCITFISGFLLLRCLILERVFFLLHEIRR